jgi:Zn-finger nucleic acid-binding protein
MSRNSRKKDSGSVRVELKYCEHCGGLWVREGGGGVYCERCQPKVADLAMSKRRKRSNRLTLPQRSRTVLEEPEFEIRNFGDLEAAGGVA